jgi:peptide/nickel transport system permease protein
MRLLRIGARLLAAVPVALGVAVIVFFFLRLLPGDPVEIMLGDAAARTSDIDALRRQMNLDEPLLVQLVQFLGGVATGDFGHSIVRNRPVADLVWATVPATLELTFATILVGTLIALPIGVLSAVRRGSLFDRLMMSGAMLGVSMPAFWFGLILILVFSVMLGWLPTSGRLDPGMDIHARTGFMVLDALLSRDLVALRSALLHLVLPAVTLGVVFAAILVRVIRSSMVEALKMDYVTVARAKGATPWSVVVRHALRNALIPAITVAGLEVGALLGGNMIVETIFAWPGLGRLVVSSIFARDYVVVQAAVMLYAFTYVAANLIVDVLYTVLNPRIELT